MGAVLSPRAKQVNEFIQKIPDHEFASLSDDAISAKAFAEFSIVKVTLRLDETEMEHETIKPRTERSNSFLYGNNFGRSYGATLRVTIRIPFDGDPLLWKLTGSVSRLAGTRGHVKPNTANDGGVLSLLIEQPAGVSNEQIKREYDREIDNITFNLQNQTTLIDQANASLPVAIKGAIERRRKAHGERDDLAAMLGARVAKRPISQAQQTAPSVSRSASVAAPKKEHKNTFDVFICHASEVKVGLVNSLASTLIANGLNVWYDDFVLTVGDSLRTKIDEGLSLSRFGIVVLSPRFFEKHWPRLELDGLVAKEVRGKKVILPVWFEVTRDEVESYSLILAGRLAANCAKGMDAVVADLLKAIRS